MASTRSNRKRSHSAILGANIETDAVSPNKRARVQKGDILLKINEGQYKTKPKIGSKYKSIASGFFSF